MIASCGVWQGLGRFDFDGRPTHKVTSNVVSSLANPLVSPPLCVRLSNLCVALPKGLYPTLAKLAHNSEPPLFQLRLAVHNGRAFVGRPVLTRAVHYDETSNMLEVTEDVYVRGIPLDILVVLRVEVQVPIPDDLPQRKGCVVPQLLKGAPLLNPSLEKLAADSEQHCVSCSHSFRQLVHHSAPSAPWCPHDAMAVVSLDGRQNLSVALACQNSS